MGNMKLFVGVVALASAQSLEYPVTQLAGFLADASAKLNVIFGQDSYEDKWRRRNRKILQKCIERSAADVNRRVVHDYCDISESSRSALVESSLDDDVERAMLQTDYCIEHAKPLQRLSQLAKAWMDRWNSSQCGGGKDRPGFRNRQWRRFRLVRKDFYCHLECADNCKP